MKLEIMNCFMDKIVVEIGELEDIDRIDVLVLSGDEILKVTKKDGAYIEEDSDRHNRCMSFYDGEYTIYDQRRGIDRIKEWEKRKDPNDWVM